MGTATISFGPKLGLLNNAAIGQTYFNQLRPLIQALDQLIMGQVINATTVVPPASPNNGDAYLISSTASGAWASFPVNSIAVWDTQVTQSGTNNLAPAWVNYVPNAGWTVWNVAIGTFLVFTGSAWSTVGSGANFPTNTDITSMTGIPDTTISSAGYNFNPGSAAINSIVSSVGIQFGAGSFNDSTTTGAILGNQAWTGFAYSGPGIGVWSSTSATIIVPGQIGTGGVNCTSIACSGLIETESLRVGTATVGTPGVVSSGAPGQTLSIGPLGSTSFQTGVMISSSQITPASGIGLLGFDPNYFTQTTVGAAGSASALPAFPKGYLQFTAPDGTICVFPYYAHA